MAPRYRRRRFKRRFGRRRFYRRRYRRSRKTFKKRSVYKRAARWTKKAIRKIRRVPYGSIYLPFSSRAQNLYLENNQSFELVADVFQTPTAPTAQGHAIYRYTLADILQTQDLFDIVKYYHWAMLSFAVTFKVTGFRNLYKYVEPEGGANKVFFYHNPTPSNTSLELYVANFANNPQMLACTALAENSLANRNKLQECGAYKRLFASGKPLTFTWRQNTGSYGNYSTIPTTPSSTDQLPTLFGNASEHSMFPHGLDFLWYDVDHFLGSGTNKKATIIVSATFHSVIRLINRKPDYT